MLVRAGTHAHSFRRKLPGAVRKGCICAPPEPAISAFHRLALGAVGRGLKVDKHWRIMIFNDMTVTKSCQPYGAAQQRTETCFHNSVQVTLNAETIQRKKDFSCEAFSIFWKFNIKAKNHSRSVTKASYTCPSTASKRRMSLLQK